MEALCNHGGDIIKALNVNVYGNGTQTVVLAHGYGSDQTVWHYLIPYIAFYFKVVVFDLVIAGNVNPKLYDPKRYSDFNGYAQDLVCLLDQLNVNNTIYVGHSMSALVGCIAATKRPELFKHLILLSGSPRYLNGKGYTGGFEKSQLNTVFNQIDKDFSNWVQSFARIAVIVNSSTAVAEFEGSLGRMRPKIALSAAKTVFLSDNREVLPHVLVPSFIIQSEKDNVVPKSVAFYMKRNLGGHAKVKILKTEGHFPQLTATPLVLKVLNKILRVKT
ncbi:hypothetical protein UlMin_005297 [Ulmus minor]